MPESKNRTAFPPHDPPLKLMLEIRLLFGLTKSLDLREPEGRGSASRECAHVSPEVCKGREAQLALALWKMGMTP